MFTAFGDDYYVAGVSMALSLVLEGPAPSFLSKELFAALTGKPDTVHVSIHSLPESTLTDDLIRVCCGV